MPNKQLTAKVRLNTREAEKSIDNLVKKINNINNAVNKMNGSNTKVERTLNQTNSKFDSIITKTRRWAREHANVNNGFRQTGGLLSSIHGKLVRLASTYLGVMGTKAMVNASDTLTSAENKLNYVSAQNLGASGTNADGAYSAATLNATQDALDKMYASSQKVRMSYSDMMSNVSKSMALAGDAFKNNTDNAIRFQEIMAEAYAIGGASAAEMSSSMYQLIQALGSGTLAGDELRSVREGAPLAYKAIEQFAQGVYNTEESLKDLASQGKITSDMVIAAVMNAGNEMDSAFAQTKQTFAQTWDQIKNAAMYAFKPIATMLRDTLNQMIDNGFIQKVEVLFASIAKGILIAFGFFGWVVELIVDNWNWLKHIIVIAIITIVVWLSYLAYQSIINGIKAAIAWIPLHSQLLLTVAAIVLVIYAFYLLATSSETACKIILTILSIIGIAMAVILFPKFITWLKFIGFAIYYYSYLAVASVGAALKTAYAWAIANWQMLLIILVIAAIVVAIIWLADSFEDACGMIVGVIMGFVSVVWNLFVTLVTAIIKWAILPLLQAWDNFANVFGNLFNDPIAAIIHSFGGLADNVLSILQTIANGIDAVFGSNLSSAVEGWRGTLATKVQSLAAKYGNGTYEKKSDITTTIDALISKVSNAALWDTSSAYEWGYGVGKSGANWITNTLDKIGSGLTLDGLGEKFGLDFSELGAFPTIGASPSGLGGSDGLGDLGKNVGKVADNTGKISDSMDLTSEDLEYLRRIADMEWKKEYTTASINIDMSNYNTVNGDGDLDGIVTKLVDKLYEEMNSVANGVYA